MKKYFKKGLGLLLPLLLAAWIIIWIYGIIEKLTTDIIPEQWGNEWWYPIAALVIFIIAVFLLGLIFDLIKPLKWIYQKIEKWLFQKIPIFNKVYGFGKEISDAFITDVKNDGDLKVVETNIFNARYIGVLIDEKNNTIFVPTAPNPTNGFLFRTEDYKILDIDYMDALKFVTSIGKINGGKWKNV